MSPETIEPAPAARLPAYAVPSRPRPLDGVRLVDLTNAVAGPIATQLLAALGAEVIRVETPWGRPRTPSAVAPLAEGAPDQPWNRFPLMNELHHSKRSLVLNLVKPEGRAVLLDLVAVSDVLVENFSPRVMGNFDLEWDVLQARNPRLIFASMPAFGKSGPYRDRTSFGPGIDAMSGLAWLTGYPDDTPFKPGNFYCDQNAGLHTALSIVAALRARDDARNNSGEGQTVELAMLEGELQLVGDALLGVQLTGRDQTRVGNAHRCWAPHGVYPAAGDDQWLAIVCRSDADWDGLLAAIGEDAPDAAARLTNDTRFRTALRRWRHRAALDEIVSDWSRSRPADAIAERLQRRTVPASALMGTRNLLRDEQFLARQAAGSVEHPQTGPSPVPQAAFRLSRTPAPPVKGAPLFAQDNDYVFRTLLGYDDAKIDALVTEGVTSYELLSRPQ